MSAPSGPGPDAAAQADQRSGWETSGGDAVFEALPREFSAKSAHRPLQGLFPADLDETMRTQFAFQSVCWGGPLRSRAWRGHPRQRARNLPFPIGLDEAQTWLECMHQAVRPSAKPAALHARTWGRWRAPPLP